MLIYWAHPIDLADDTDQEWPTPDPPNATVYDPARAFRSTRDADAALNANVLVLLQADLLIAYIPAVRTFGVPIEVEYAIQNGKAVIVVVDGTDQKAATSLVLLHWAQRGARIVDREAFLQEVWWS